MAEEGAPDEYLILTTEVTALKKALAGLESAETTSKACKRVMTAMKEAEASDAFLVGEGPKDPNKYHTNAGGSGGDGGCCVVA